MGLAAAAGLATGCAAGRQVETGMEGPDGSGPATDAGAQERAAEQIRVGGTGGAPVPPPSPGPKTVDVRANPAPPPFEPAPLRIDPQRQPTLPSASANRPVPPISGGSLRVLLDGMTAIAGDPDRDELSVVDLQAGRQIATIALEAGDEPGRIEEDSHGRIHVVLRRGGAVVTVSPTDWTIAGRRKVCPAPRGIAYQSRGDLLHVACAGGELVSLPAAGGAAVRTVRLDRDLRDVVVTDEGVVVSTFRKAEVLTLDAEGKEVGRRRPPIALNLTRRDRTGMQPVSETRFEPVVAWRTVAAPGGGVLMLHQRGYTGEVSSDSGQVAANYGGLGCGGIVQTVVTHILPGQRVMPSPEIVGGVLATDLAMAPDGRIAIVSGADAHIQGAGSLVTVGPLGPLTADTISGCTGSSLIGLSVNTTVVGMWSEAATHLSSNRLPGEAIAVRFDGRGHVVVQMRHPREIRVPARGLVIPLSGLTERANVVDAGHAVFHANGGGGIACASCHPEGGEDGRAWRFSRIGPRRTQSLRGGISSTAPLHWDGDMKDVRHIVTEVFTGRMGGPAVSGEQAAMVGHWLDSIPLVPPSPEGSADAIARGQALFSGAAAACATCHTGTATTNNMTVDVGTGGPRQVPSLRGLWLRAPYMHDGCAPKLAGRFDESCGGARHGGLGLPPHDVADLQAYLDSL